MVLLLANRHAASKLACREALLLWHSSASLPIWPAYQAACQWHHPAAAGGHHRHRTFATPAASGVIEQATVCFLDPRLLLDGNEQVSAKDVCELSVPTQMLPTLSQGVLELGDADDPLVAWVWGRKAELFDYQLVGSHSTRSGFMSIILKQQLQSAMQQAAHSRNLPTWSSFQQRLQHADTAKTPREQAELFKPFLFAGRILESSHASVYVLKAADGKVAGILVSSAAAEQDEVD